MKAIQPRSFYQMYLNDFDKPDGPGLLQLSWDNSSSALWTYLNLAYITKQAFKLDFTPEAERKVNKGRKLDLCWLDRSPQQLDVHCVLAVEEEWAAQPDDADLTKLIGVKSDLKVFITALEYPTWINREFHLTVAEQMRAKTKQFGEYLVMNISPFPLMKTWNGLRLDGFLVDSKGNISQLPSREFPSAHTDT
jgi:hypothetical protein